jgi:phosphoglycerate dehydrogenase-like enzyme
MARACDILMVSTPGGPATHNLIDARILDALGPQCVLINIARGTVVDEPALIAALRDGRILSAGLDVFAGEPQVPAELVAMDHVVLLPHVGSASHVTRDAMSALVVENLVSFASGRGPLTPIAETPWRSAGKAAQ